MQRMLNLLPLLQSDPISVEKAARYYYEPLPDFAVKLQEFKSFLDSPKPPDDEAKEHRAYGGRLLEQLAYILFKGLTGCGRIESVETAGSQLDLVVEGGPVAWSFITRLLGLAPGREGILVEAKAYKRKGKKVDIQDMARLCSVIDHHLRYTVGLGVFITPWGVTGDKLKALKDARLHQAAFFFRTGIPIIILTLQDLECFTKRGMLIQHIYNHIRELELLARRGARPDFERVALPKHLKELGL